jgi:hypothetical protein
LSSPPRIFCVSCLGAYRASSPERRGVASPTLNPSSQPANILITISGPTPEKMRRGRTQTKSSENHASASSKRRIIQANSPANAMPVSNTLNLQLST